MDGLCIRKLITAPASAVTASHPVHCLAHSETHQNMPVPRKKWVTDKDFVSDLCKEQGTGTSSYFSDSCGNPGVHDICHRVQYSRAHGDPEAPSTTQAQLLTKPSVQCPGHPQGSPISPPGPCNTRSTNHATKPEGCLRRKHSSGLAPHHVHGIRTDLELETFQPSSPSS